MEYVLIIILQIIGIALHAGQKVVEIDKRCPNDTLPDVIRVFFREDITTLLISFVVLILNVVVHYILEEYTDIMEAEYAALYAFGAALVLGYAGQRLIYRYLGKAESFLNKKVDDKLT